MSKSTVTLMYLGSYMIEAYIARHPIDWSNRELAKRGGPGDQAGMPPTESVYEFFSLLSQKQSLFPQQEYRDYCVNQWQSSGWWSSLDQRKREGVAAKLCRNFYPSMINTLHAWSLLVEAGWFDVCVIDTLTDAISKHDLLVYRGNDGPVALDLFIQSDDALKDRQYKLTHRKSSRDIECRSFPVPLPWRDRPKRQPGNMRWYCLRDFESVYLDVLRREYIYDVPLIPCTCGYHVERRTA